MKIAMCELDGKEFVFSNIIASEHQDEPDFTKENLIDSLEELLYEYDGDIFTKCIHLEMNFLEVTELKSADETLFKVIKCNRKLTQKRVGDAIKTLENYLIERGGFDEDRKQ